MGLKDFVNLRLVNLYIFIFLLFIFLFNEIPVNEEFYISIGLLFFLVYIIFLGAKSLINSLNVRVKNDFFIFIGVHEYVYNHFIELFKFFKFDLYFWVLLHNLYKLLYNYKKFLIYKKLDFNYMYEYIKNTLISLVLENYIINFYNIVLLTMLEIMFEFTANMIYVEYNKKLTNKSLFMRKKCLSIIHLFKKTIVF